MVLCSSSPTGDAKVGSDGVSPLALVSAGAEPKMALYSLASTNSLRSSDLCLSSHKEKRTPTNDCTSFSSYPFRLAESTTSVSSGASSFARSAGGSSIRPASGIAAMGAASPILPPDTMRMSLQARAMIAPAEYASGLIHAVVGIVFSYLSSRQISSMASSSPPGVSNSMMTPSTPSFRASVNLLLTDFAVSESIGVMISMMASLSAWREAGTGPLLC